MKFDSDPDYQYLRLLFHQLFLEKGYENDWGFDWCKKANNEGAAEEKDDKELLEANDKKNGNNAEKRNDISKELEGSNNVTNADTDRSNITSVNNTDLKQVSEAKGDQKAQNEIKAPSRSVNFDDPVGVSILMTIMPKLTNQKAEVTCKKGEIGLEGVFD